MRYLEGHSLREQTAENQSKVLRQFEKDDEISVVLEEKGSISGPIISVDENGPSENPEEVHVQFLNYESDFRNDDQGHHTVTITQTEDGDWARAELTYSWTDTGRVRIRTVDEVKRVWPSVSQVVRTTVLSREEANIFVMKELGLTEQEIANQWDCDERTIDAILANIRNAYRRAERTIDRLESSPIDLDGRIHPSVSPTMDSTDW